MTDKQKQQQQQQGYNKQQGYQKGGFGGQTEQRPGTQGRYNPLQEKEREREKEKR